MSFTNGYKELHGSTGFVLTRYAPGKTGVSQPDHGDVSRPNSRRLPNKASSQPNTLKHLNQNQGSQADLNILEQVIQYAESLEELLEPPAASLALLDNTTNEATTGPAPNKLSSKMHSRVLIHFTLAALFGTSTAVVVPKHEPRDFPVVNSTPVVDNTTIYYPGPVDVRRVSSGPIPVPEAVSKDGTSDTTKKDFQHEGKDVLKRTGLHEEGKKETRTHAFYTPLPTDYGMTAGGGNFPRMMTDKEAIKREDNAPKEGEQSCSCPCQCPTMEAPKKKQKLSKGAIAGIVIGSVVGAALVLYGLLLWLVEKFFNW